MLKKLSFSLKKGTFYRRKKTTRHIIAPFETMTLSADEEFDICVVILVILLAIYHNSFRQQNYLKRQARRLHRSMRDQILKLSNVYTSLHQASKWGMRGLQGSFPRCKKRLPTNQLQRRKILEAIIFVHNFRTEVVGYSQIQTVFDPKYERSITLEGYNRIAQYYLHPGDYVTDEDSDDNNDDDDDSI